MFSALKLAKRMDPSFAPSITGPNFVRDNYEDIILFPNYVGQDVGGPYDWNLVTVPQTQLDGVPRPMPQGKALGGGSILNAMAWNRGGQDDYNAWEALGNPGWGWGGMLPYFIKVGPLSSGKTFLVTWRKSENYTPMFNQSIASAYSIQDDASVHGFSGPVNVGYPRYFYPQSSELEPFLLAC